MTELSKELIATVLSTPGNIPVIYFKDIITINISYAYYLSYVEYEVMINSDFDINATQVIIEYSGQFILCRIAGKFIRFGNPPSPLAFTTLRLFSVWSQ